MEKPLRYVVGSTGGRKEYFDIEAGTEGWATNRDNKEIQTFIRITFKSSENVKEEIFDGAESNGDGFG